MTVIVDCSLANDVGVIVEPTQEHFIPSLYVTQDHMSFFLNLEFYINNK